MDINEDQMELTENINSLLGEGIMGRPLHAMSTFSLFQIFWYIRLLIGLINNIQTILQILLSVFILSTTSPLQERLWLDVSFY